MIPVITSNNTITIETSLTGLNQHFTLIYKKITAFHHLHTIIFEPGRILRVNQLYYGWMTDNMKKKITVSIALLLTVFLGFSLFNSFPQWDINLKYNYLGKNYSTAYVENIYVVLVDGLRYDAVLKSMPHTAGFIKDKRACLVKCLVDGPSNSRPGYARIFTGTGNKTNGIWFNWQPSKCRVMSIFQVAAHSGKSTGASAFYWIGQLFNDSWSCNKLFYDSNNSIQYAYFYSRSNEDDEKIFSMGTQIIKKYNPTLCLIHPMGVDKAGHKYGGSSKRYSDSVSKIDTLIYGLIQNIDLCKSVLIITSDHGHRDSGGHGGKSATETEVPIIFMGSIVNGGICSEIAVQKDIAPTILNLLSLPPTPYMKGKIIESPFKKLLYLTI